jgi:hypothetical protein
MHMIRRIAAVTLALTLVGGMAVAEPYYVSVAATTTAATSFFRASSSVLLCNDGVGIAYFRLFHEFEYTADATASSSQLPVGACIEYTKSPTQPANWNAVSLISASTSTVRLYGN